MRSFFNKPSWASRGEETQDLKFYQHAGQVYNDIISTNQHARRANQIQENETKRRRTPIENHGGDTLPLGTCKPSDESLSHQLPSDGNASNCRSVPGSEGQLGRQAPDALPHGQGVTDPSGIDHLIPGLASRSRDEIVTSGTSAVKNPSGGKRSCLDNSQPSNRLSPTKPHLTPSKKLTSSEDTIVQILITSKISNTKPLIVRRKIHQPLKDVRLAWLNRQDLPKGLESSIFLTWKGKRLFDVTTCRSLGIGPKGRHAHGPVTCDFLRSDSSDLQIHMEAATDNPLDLDNGRSLSSANPAPGADMDTGGRSLKNIVLKAPGLDDLRLRVSLQMQVSQLIRRFRDARQISLEHEVYLVFDGERLDLGCALEDYDLANDDLLDVIVK
ncbi:hypothetical protein ASPACDRAFT_119130 [Aspergillus aculeatus ATCC 16872]|uniref:Ubiquitin-like domain-containing protein n=1 Tax=Aspergillus aculeatus (strain ATCC 16872 / CBS 172.66 / WB 5094) TaxID=690307 RepID=A0A1L9WWS1_ASPA1|nr:uncharacterized protein ASPACDRAFT_119130 [Aspergillus aculeatus ATCC 16872]OJK00593.1 hypothetical protein ASPACDRAFT_119130 [Aspergillus aculeatus ATCC 16872]